MKLPTNLDSDGMNTKFFIFTVKDLRNAIAYGSLSKKQFDAEINKGIKDIDEDRVYSVDDVEEEILRDFIKKLKNRKR